MFDKIETMSRAMDERMREFEKQVQETGQKELVDGFTRIFNENPAILGIKWRQYTPYFNDGEECVFGVCELSFNLDVSLLDDSLENDEEAGDYGDGWMSAWDVQYYHKSLENHPINAVLAEIDNAITGNEDAMRIIFGDHVQIEVDRDGMDVSEYDHE